jgi:large subunit ribosomal protein L29
MSKQTKELKALSEGQLKDRLSELEMEMIKHNAQVATGSTPKSPGLIRQTKRNIARILTILHEKEGGEDQKV